MRRLLALPPLVALLALAGPAAPVRADVLPAFSLTTTASEAAYAAPGQREAVEWFTEDSGADALRVTMSLAELNPESQQSPALALVRAIRPEHFRLASGASRYVRVVVKVPKGTPAGQLYVNVEASASVPGNSVTGAVAGTLEVIVS